MKYLNKICLQDGIPTRVKDCCEGTSGLSADKEQKMIENYERIQNNPEKPILNDSMPGLFTQASTFIKAVADYTLAGFPAMPEGESERRLNICRSCPEFVPESSQCRQCGCFMNLKTQLATSACPLGLWAAVSPKKEGLPPVDDNPLIKQD